MIERGMNSSPSLESLLVLGLPQLGVSLKETQPAKLLILSTVAHQAYAMGASVFSYGKVYMLQIFGHTV